MDILLSSYCNILVDFKFAEWHLHDHICWTKIYVVPIEDLMAPTKEVTASRVLEFKYSGKKSRNSETIISYEDKLLIFTKSGKGNTRIYSLDKNNDDQKAKELGKLFSYGSITGGYYDAEKTMVVLTGYRKLSEQLYKGFIWKVEDMDLPFDQWKTNLTDLDIGAQIEGITYLNNEQYLVSAEGTKLSPPRLFTLDR